MAKTLFLYDNIPYREKDLISIGNKLAEYWGGKYIDYRYNVEQSRLRFICRRKKTNKKFHIELSFSYLSKYLERKK